LSSVNIVDLGSSPEKSRPGISQYAPFPRDLVLLKLQIHNINRKDLSDPALLFVCIDLALNDESNKINANYVVIVAFGMMQLVI